MKKLYFLIITAIGSLSSFVAAIVIIAYDKGKSTVDKIKARQVKSNKNKI